MCKVRLSAKEAVAVDWRRSLVASRGSSNVGRDFNFIIKLLVKRLCLCVCLPEMLQVI